MSPCLLCRESLDPAAMSTLRVTFTIATSVDDRRVDVVVCLRCAQTRVVRLADLVDAAICGEGTGT